MCLLFRSRCILLLLRIVRRPRLQHRLLPVNHRVHVVDEVLVVRLAVEDGEGVHRLHERAVGGFGGGAAFLDQPDAGGTAGFAPVSGGDGFEESFLFGIEVVQPRVERDGGADVLGPRLP